MTPDFSAAFFSATYWAMVFITLLLAGMTVGLHYEALERFNRWIPHWSIHPRVRILGLIVGILIAHTIEIWVFGIGIYFVTQIQDMGTIAGLHEVKLLDAVYLSAMTFTTVGYGEVSPQGPLRFLAGSEALTGLVLITWSASFTYLEMQRYWRPR